MNRNVSSRVLEPASGWHLCANVMRLERAPRSRRLRLLARSLLCCAALFSPLIAEGAPVRVILRTAGRSSGAPPNLRVVARPTGVLGSEDRRSERVMNVTGPAAMLELEPGLWSLAARATGFWAGSKDILLMDDREPREVTIALWPTGALSGRVGLAPGVEAPAQIKVVFASAAAQNGDRGEAIGPSVVGCLVRDRTWACDLPATLLDLQVRATGFVPLYIWGVAIRRGGTLDLKAVTMRRGASVSGFVKRSDRSPASRCRVTVMPARAPLVPVMRNEDRRGGSLSAATNERGFFQIGGVPPGAYEVVAQASEGEEASAAVAVMADAESALLTPLELATPATLVLNVSPPTPPTGGPWKLSVVREGQPRSTLARDVLVPENGEWRRERAAPGHYRVVLGDERGAKWAVTQMELDPSSGPVAIDVPVLKIRGTVRLGSTPLRARLVFGGQFGSVRVPLESDEDGQFEGVIPAQPGTTTFSVFVESKRPSVRRTVENVVVYAPTGSEADVEIQLPSTTLKGVVVDTDARPVTRAILTVTPLGDGPLEQKVINDEKGEFEFDGLAPAQYRLSAEAQGLMSAEVPVKILEDKDTPSVRLVMKTTSDLVLKVVSPEGDAVPGALVRVVPAQAPLGTAPVLATDVQGQVQLTLPPGTRELGLGVGAPGYAYRIFRARVPERSPLTVAVDRSAGTIRIESPDKSLAYAFLFHGGFFQSATYLEQVWIGRGGGARTQDQGSWVLSDLAPGFYALCLATTSAELESLVVTGGRSGSTCATGTLHPGGELSLVLVGRSER